MELLPYEDSFPFFLKILNKVFQHKHNSKVTTAPEKELRFVILNTIKSKLTKDINGDLIFC